VDHGDGVAEEGLLGEHVDLPELPVHSAILAGSSYPGLLGRHRLERISDGPATLPPCTGMTAAETIARLLSVVVAA
jgi:hypothetical protein